MTAFVYILASGFNGTLYIGVTTELERRIADHKRGAIPGFTKRYGVKTLVYCEEFDDVRDAIRRETQMKRWRRDWKKNLIEHDNPHWEDLAAGWFGHSTEPGRSREFRPKPRPNPKPI